MLRRWCIHPFTLNDASWQWFQDFQDGKLRRLSASKSCSHRGNNYVSGIRWIHNPLNITIIAKRFQWSSSIWQHWLNDSTQGMIAYSTCCYLFSNSTSTEFNSVDVAPEWMTISISDQSLVDLWAESLQKAQPADPQDGSDRIHATPKILLR